MRAPEGLRRHTGTVFDVIADDMGLLWCCYFPTETGLKCPDSECLLTVTAELQNFARLLDRPHAALWSRPHAYGSASQPRASLVVSSANARASQPTSMMYRSLSRPVTSYIRWNASGSTQSVSTIKPSTRVGWCPFSQWAQLHCCHGSWTTAL
jgi:hypothetical protein